MEKRVADVIDRHEIELYFRDLSLHLGQTHLCSLFWDCACEEDYIHFKNNSDNSEKDNHCETCGVTEKEDAWPDSRIEEVIEMFPQIPLHLLIKISYSRGFIFEIRPRTHWTEEEIEEIKKLCEEE